VRMEDDDMQSVHHDPQAAVCVCVCVTLTSNLIFTCVRTVTQGYLEVMDG